MLSILRHNALWLVLAVLFAIQLMYGITVVAYFNPSDWISSDFAAYVTAMLQHDIPGSLPHDSLFGDGRFADTLWASSWIFMTLLQTFYHLGGERIEIGAMLFSLVLLVGYVCAMYTLALTLLHDRRLAIGVAACGSLAFEIFLIGPYILAQALFATLTPLLLVLLLRVWLLPGLAQGRIVPWHVLACGGIVGLTPFLINSTSALGFICFTLAIAGLQWLFRRLPLWTIIVYLAALVPLLILRIFGGIGVVTGLSANGIQYMAALYQGYENNVLPYGTYALLTLISGLIIWSYPRWRGAKIFFITLQFGMTLSFFYTGWTPIFVWLYGVYRILAREDDALDSQLLLTIVVALWVGPLLQLALYYVWRVTNISLLVGIIFETARFARYGYIPLYLLAARAVGIMVAGFPFSPPPHAALQSNPDFTAQSPEQPQKTKQAFETHPNTWQTTLFLSFLFMLLLLNAFYNTQPTVIHVSLVLAGAAALGLRYWQTRHQKNIIWWQRGLLVSIGGVTLVCGVLYANLVFQGAIQRMTPTVASHYEVTTWARENTPLDSVFHVPWLDESFRFLAQRSMVIALGDVTRSLYSTRDPFEMQALVDASLVETDAIRLTGFAARYDADYVVLDNTMPDLLPSLYQDIWYAPELVYQNAHFRVYHVPPAAWLDERPYPLVAAAAADFAAVEPKFEVSDTALVFNPIAGDFFNYVGVENWLPAYTLRDGAAVVDAATLTTLVQYMRSSSELDADVSQRWQRNFLPGDLKAANIAYVFMTQQWLDTAGAYVQAMFANDNDYALVGEIPALITPETYLLYRVVGNTTETLPPPTPAELLPLPIEIPANAPLLVSALTAWRGQQLFHWSVDNRVCITDNTAPDCPLYVAWQGDNVPNAANIIADIPNADEIKALTRGQETVFIISSSDVAHETRRLLADLATNGYIADGGIPVPLTPYPDLTLTLYQARRVPENLQTVYQLGTEPIRLQHIAVTAPETLAPCATIGIQTWWQHDVTPAQNYFITLRLVAENGDVITQSDGRVGEHRLTELPAGSMYYDHRWLTVPCAARAGIYTVQAGLYAYENGTYGALLAATDDNGAVVPVPITLASLTIN